MYNPLSPKTFQSITSRLQKMVDELQGLAAKKTEEASIARSMATSLEAKAIQDDAEANKAYEASKKISQLVGSDI